MLSLLLQGIVTQDGWLVHLQAEVRTERTRTLQRSPMASRAMTARQMVLENMPQTCVKLGTRPVGTRSRVTEQ